MKLYPAVVFLLGVARFAHAIPEQQQKFLEDKGNKIEQAGKQIKFCSKDEGKLFCCPYVQSGPDSPCKDPKPAKDLADCPAGGFACCMFEGKNFACFSVEKGLVMGKSSFVMGFRRVDGLEETVE
ncbi:hypothetical protein K469DRAFT_751652 [Zopfia rhizophila CBS 207.26]|uniref:Uncharacterized protein n=1 Tax=Zopfia rhizophila CBS 207.26 TaxID=1314779 RepID=A0A6A6DYG9_9PEZI|nr:hypothetical protein K469DRAFT_751652 [Zopfia rhizophila CBS 207.26]